MAWQSAWEQAKSVRLHRHTVIGLVAGILVGLTLGLLIGWVWWPVEWQGPASAAVPAATTGTGAQLGSQVETPEAKALYLGAVADAFVYASAAGNTDAAALAAQRLAALGGDMRAAFNNAIDFYSAQAGGATRINNLTTLAMAVGIPLDSAASGSAATAPTAAALAPAEAGEGAAASSGSTAATSNSGSPNWLLTLLVALLLIGGGIYILWYLQRRPATTEGGGAFAEEGPAPAAESSAAAFARDELNPPRTSYTPAASVRSTVGRPQAAQAGGFDSEDLNEYSNLDEEDRDENGDDQRYAAEDARDAHFGYRGVNVEDEDRDDWDDEGDEEAEGAEAETPAERRGPLPSGFVTSVGATPPFSGATGSPEGRQPSTGAGTGAVSAQAAGQPSAVQAAPARTPPPTLQPPTPSRYEHFTPVESYTATYYVGRTDFDYTKNVPSPSGEGYDGEYGIGIHEKLGLLNNDLEKVIAIDVYLFDKTDERQPITISRSLLSLFADKRRAEFERAGDRENKTLPPIVAQPNTNFQLEGRQLLLDCLIKQVDYTPEGYFRSVTVELVLKHKD